METLIGAEDNNKPPKRYSDFDNREEAIDYLISLKGTEWLSRPSVDLDGRIPFDLLLDDPVGILEVWEAVVKPYYEAKD